MRLKFIPKYPSRDCESCNVTMHVMGASFECPQCRAYCARREFVIPMDSLPRLEERFQKLARRASRLSVEGPSLVIGERVDIPEVNIRGVETGAIASFLYVKVEGVAPKLPGYELVAVIRHLQGEEDANLVTTVGEHRIPESFRHTGPICDHCHVKRNRNDTFVVRHDSGKLVQVGRSCLRDYLGHGSIERIATIAELIADALDAMSEFDGDLDIDFFATGERHVKDWHLVTYLAYVSAVIDRHGWCSRATAMAHEGVDATSDAAWRWMIENYQEMKRSNGHHAVRLQHPEPSERDYARANTARDWAMALHENLETLSDYEHNVNVVARVSRVDRKTRGVGASILVACDRAHAKKAERQASQWFGKVKVQGDKKYKRETYELKVLAAIEVGINSRFGSSTLHILRDTNGNKAVWTTKTTLEVGTTYKLKVTVDEHSEYKGEKQTVLSRCEVVEKVEAHAPGETDASVAA